MPKAHTPLTHTQRVGAFMLKAGRAVYLREIIRGTRLNKNQAATVLSSLCAADIVEALETAAPARRFIVRDRPALQAKTDHPNAKGGDHHRRLDFGPLMTAMPWPPPPKWTEL